MLFGLELAIMGMGTVFVFLVILIGVTQLMSTLVIRYENKQTQLTEALSSGLHKTLPDAKLKAIIQSAIQEHLQQNKSSK